MKNFIRFVFCAALAVASLGGQTIYPTVQRGKATALADTRVPLVDSGGRLTDDADLTFVTDTLTFTKGVTTQLALGATTPGLITGSSGAITLTGAGTNQTITLTPSGTGLLQTGAKAAFIPTVLPRPVEPVVTAGGTNNAGANYRYVVVNRGAGNTAASAQMVSPFAGNSTIDGTHFNIIQTVAQTGIEAVDIYRTATGTPTSLGYIGTATPGAAFNDTGLTAGGQTVANVGIPSSDFGSAGEYFTGPLVVYTAATPVGNFGGFHIGDAILPIMPGEAAQTQAVRGPLAIFTQNATASSNGVYFQGVDGGALVFRAAGTSMTKPVAQGGGVGTISGESFCSSSLRWEISAFSEFGNSGNSATTATDLYGRWQFAVRSGTVDGTFTKKGMTLSSKAAYVTNSLNAVGLLLTNYTDFRQYRTGYTETSSNDDTDPAGTFERVDGTWSNGGNTYNFGPVAGSGATLRPMTLTGASVNIDSGVLNTAGNRVGYNLSAYGVGTAYSLTNTAAAVDFGTTDPVKVLDKAGTYLISAQVHLTYNAATVVAETATVKVRRTNNTAADLSAVVVLDLPVATTLTNTYGIFQIPPFVYTTSATDDSVSIFANVSAGLGAGTIDATAIGTSIVAVRLY